VRRFIIPALSLVLSLASLGTGGCSPNFYRQPLSETIVPATPEESALLHGPEELRADLDAIVALHEQACPDPYMHIDRDTIIATRDRLKASINGALLRREFLPLVMELEAAYCVDHMIVTAPIEDLVADLRAGVRLLPFRARVEDGGLTIVAVAETDTAFEPGDRITRIGGEPADSVAARMLRLIPGESPRFQAARLQASFVAYAWAAGIRPPVEVEFLRGGAAHVAEALGVMRENRATERKLSGDASLAAPLVSGTVLVEHSPFRCLLLEGDIGYIDFPTMSVSFTEEWEAFLVEAIGALNDRSCKGLVVDIRRNGGGDSRLGEVLLEHLTDKPYRMTGGLTWRRSEPGFESMRQSVKPGWRWLIPIAMPLVSPEYAALDDGEETHATEEPHVGSQREPRFLGPTALLIGEGTFSSAMMLADAARTFDLMITIGSPTGGLPTTLGELGFMALPHTKLWVQFCQKKFLRASGDASDIGPVLPHIEVAPTANGDAALDRAIAELRRAG
jgi:hypothetical protein